MQRRRLNASSHASTKACICKDHASPMQAHASLCKPCSLMQPHAASCSLVQPHAASHRGKGGAHISSCYNRSIFRTNDHHQKFLVEVMMESLSDSHAEDILHGTCICNARAHAALSAECKYLCTVLAWYLHGCMVYLHGICMGLHAYAGAMQVRRTASKSRNRKKQPRTVCTSSKRDRCGKTK